MTDPLKRVLPGDPLAGYPAEALNYMMDAARKVNSGQSGLSGESVAGSDKSTINVKNSTGDDLEAYSVIGLTRSVVYDETDNIRSYKRDPVIVGNTPSEQGRFAITLQPIPNGKRGRAMVLGVSYCKVDVTDADHEFADIASGETGYLRSAETGTARILRKPDGTGELDCVVMLTGVSADDGEGNGNGGDSSSTCCGECNFNGPIDECTEVPEAPQFYNVAFQPFGLNIELEHVGGTGNECVWASDTITYAGEDYTLTLTIGGTLPGDVTLVLEDDESETVITYISDRHWLPLCENRMHPTSMEFVGTTQLPCEVCVFPAREFVEVECSALPVLEVPARIGITLEDFDGAAYTEADGLKSMIRFLAGEYEDVKFDDSRNGPLSLNCNGIYICDPVVDFDEHFWCGENAHVLCQRWRSAFEVKGLFYPPTFPPQEVQYQVVVDFVYNTSDTTVYRFQLTASFLQRVQFPATWDAMPSGGINRLWSAALQVPKADDDATVKQKVREWLSSMLPMPCCDSPNSTSTFGIFDCPSFGPISGMATNTLQSGSVKNDDRIL
jgi:hypothetical protein